MVPSEEVAAAVELAATATKEPFPYATVAHPAEDGKVLAVQVAPVGEDAAIVPVVADTATNNPFP